MAIAGKPGASRNDSHASQFGQKFNFLIIYELIRLMQTFESQKIFKKQIRNTKQILLLEIKQKRAQVIKQHLSWSLTPCGPGMAYGDTDLDQHWFR